MREAISMSADQIDLDACYEGPGGSVLMNAGRPGEVEIFPSALPRYVFTQVNGPIPPGLVIDRTCGNRRCLNPRHMRLCTMTERAGR